MKTKKQNREEVTAAALNLEQTGKPSIAIATIPIAEAGLIFLSNLVCVLGPFVENMYIVTSHAGCALFDNNEKVRAYSIGSKSRANIFIKGIKLILSQIKISYRLALIARDTNWWCFFMGGSALLLPMITGKLMKKKVMLIYAGSDAVSMKAQSRIISKMLEPITKATASLSDRIVVYSQRLVKEYDLEKHAHKISIDCDRYIDFERFRIESPVTERDTVVGYIGRLSEEKGVLHFIEAIPGIVESMSDVTFFIGGDGQLRSKIEQFINQAKLHDTIKLTRWIDHDEIANYMNQLKLLVLPSYTEGLPNIVLEAMACGTPVLATPVGAIPDIITDGETGFIMENNSPDCIAENIIRALRQPNLGEIARNAHAYVEQVYTYESAAARFKNVISSLQ